MSHSNRYITFFVICICFCCALILSLLATSLKPFQSEAKELYLSRQLLIAAKVIDPDQDLSRTQILTIYEKRVQPRLTNQAGDILTFTQAGIDMQIYLSDNAKTGYAHLPYKLFYIVTEKDSENPYAYVFPINGYGLWDAIYGYLAVKPDADTVIGTTWYEQAETPGLGAEIATPKWQAQFSGKLIFRESPDGTTDYQTATIGIRVVKTTVAQEIGNKPAAKSAVDGISGATKTSEGVSESYKKSLTPYRPLLIRLQKKEAA